MSRMRRLTSFSSCVLIAASAAACGGSNTAIGSSPTSPSNGQPLTQAQISQVSAAVAPALSLALSKMNTALSSTTLAVRRKRGLIRPLSTSYPFSGSAACDSGGSISVNGNLVDGTDVNGSGPVTMNMTVGLSSCSESGVLLQGNPNLAFGGTFNFSNFDVVNPATVTVGGGFLFTLDGVTGSAAYSCSDSVDVNTNASTETGNVTLQYPTGQNATTASCSSF